MIQTSIPTTHSTSDRYPTGPSLSLGKVAKLATVPTATTTPITASAESSPRLALQAATAMPTIRPRPTIPPASA